MKRRGFGLLEKVHSKSRKKENAEGRGLSPGELFLERKLRERFPEHRKESGITTALLILLLTVGTGLLAYPSFANYWNHLHQSWTIMGYAEQVARMDRGESQKVIDSALEYNRRLSEEGIHWRLSEEERAAYEAEIAVYEDGTMGYIDIPKINVQLPVYHGTEEAVLMTSIGHLEATSLPVGGPGSHAVLSGHRGLPSARLFSDLDLMAEGDRFTISILNETMTYETDRIRVIDPDDLSELEIIPGEDLCTLLTCTPYGVNSHRLLVRGHRVNNSDGEARVTAEALVVRPVYVAPFLMAPLLLGLLMTLLFL